MIDCHKCEHYYVTWDKEFPHGCKTIGFKSIQFPSIVVRVNSNRECLLFEKKAKNKKGLENIVAECPKFETRVNIELNSN